VHVNAAKKGSSRASVQREEVHSFRGRKCTHKHSEEGSAHASTQRKDVHSFRGRNGTHRLSEEAWCTHMRNEEGGGHTCAQRRAVHPTRPEDGSVCKRNHKKEESAHALRAGSCTHTPPEGTKAK
jgi:hypothetical protein